MIHKFTAKFILMALIVILLAPSALAKSQPQDGGSAEEMIGALRKMDNEELSQHLGGALDFTGADVFGDPITAQEKSWQILSQSKNHLQTISDALNNKKRLDINEHDRRLLRQYLDAGLLNERGQDPSYLEAELKPYDIRVLELLDKLVMPKEKGGAGHSYVKVDRIRRNYELERKQVSRETEGAENISAHTMGQAVDISALDETQCTVKGYFRSKKTKPFPIKFEWQSPARLSSGSAILGDNFDEITKEMAFSEISDLFSGNKKIRANAWKWLFFEVGKGKLAEELGLEDGALDNTTRETFFKDVGLAMIGKKLELPDFRALDGSNLEEISIKVALSYFEYDLDLPGGSLTRSFESGTTWDADWKNILSSIGKRKVETDLDLYSGTLDDPEGNKDRIERAITSKYSDLYRDADIAFNLPDSEDGAKASSVQRIRQGEEDVYIIIGASVLADSLNYNEDEKRKIISNAENGIFAELNLNKKSFSLRLTSDEINNVFRGNNEERKQALESGGTRLLDNVLQDKIIRMDEEVKDALVEEIQTQNKNQTRLYFSDVRNIIGNKERMERITYNASAKKIENQLGLPEHSLKYTLLRDSGGKNLENIAKSLEDNFTKNVGEAFIEQSLGLQEDSLRSDDLSGWRVNGSLSRFSGNPGSIDQRLNLSPGKTAEMVRGQIDLADYKRQIGELALGGSLLDGFADGLNLPQIGDYNVKPSDLIGFFTGNWEDSLLKIGANFAEEEFDLPSGTIYRIASQEGSNTPDQIFLAAGGQRLASIFNVNYLDLNGISTVADFKSSLGRQKAEQIMGLEAGSFTGDISEVQNKNPQRMQSIKKMDDDKLKGFDLVLDIPSGSTSKLLKEETTISDFVNLVGDQAIKIAGGIEIWDRFGWDEKYGISGSELLNAVKNDRFDLVIRTFEKIAGFNLDNVFNFQPGTSAQLARAANNELERNALLIEQGVIKLTEALGMNPGFAYHFIQIYRYSDRSTEAALYSAIYEATKIPINHPEDAKAFMDGDIKKGLKFFTAAQFVEQWKEKGVFFTYDDVRAAIAFNDKDKQNLIAASVIEYYLTKDNEWARYLPSGFLKSWIQAAKEGGDAASEIQTNLLFSWLGNLTQAGKLGDVLRGIDGQDLRQLNEYLSLSSEERKNHPEMLEIMKNNGIFDSIDRNSEKWFGFEFQDGTSNAIFKYSMTNDFSGFKDDLGNAYEDWGVEKIGGWLDKQTGFKNGTFKGLYGDYDFIKGLNNNFEAGSISEEQLYSMVATRLFGKELNKLEQKNNLPPGAIQDMVFGAVAALSGNIPQAIYHVGMLYYKIFFGVWRLKCPDLQQTAQAKVRELLNDALALGKTDPKLLPSQIMTFSENDVLYFSPQLDQLYPERRVPMANYGMGVNPNMYDRVHIGY